MNNRFTISFSVILIVIAPFISVTTFGGTKTWTGTTSTVWTDANWNPVGTPFSTDDIVIPSSCTFYPVILNNRTMKSLTVNSGGSITFQASTASIDGGAVSNVGTILINGGTLDIKNATGNLTNSSSLTISSGQLKVGGTFTNNLSSNFVVSGGTTTGNITNYGTVTSSSGTAVLDGLIANQTGGLLNINGGSLEIKQEPSTNAGSIAVSSGNLFFNGKDLDNLNGGTITQTDGTIRLDHLTNSGQVTASSGTFTIDEYFTNNAGKNITVNGGSIIVKNNTSINSGSITVSSGSLDFGTAGKDLTINAGGSVTQTGGTVSIKNLTVNASGSYTYSGSSLQISGDLTNSGTVTLNTSPVNVAGKITNNASGNISIGGATVTAQDDATNYGTMSISSGSLDFNTAGKKITINGGIFNQTGGTVKTKDMELINGGTYNQSNGEFQISHDLKVPVGNTFNGTGGTVHYTGAAGGGADYTGTVQFNNVLIDAGADYNMDNNSDVIKISGNYTNNNSSLDNDKGTLNFNGTSPQTIYSASTPASTKTMSANIIVSNSTGVTLLSDVGFQTNLSLQSGGFITKNGNKIYVGGSEYTAPVPVELVSFNAKVKDNVVQLNWNTATEVNNYGFEIERQILKQVQNDKNNNWEKIGFVNGHGNSNSPKIYSFEDSKLSNNAYHYRLKQVDNDGTFTYSNTVLVSIDQMPGSFALHQNYPNPFNPSTKISWQSTTSGWQTLKVYDVLGNEVVTLVNEFREAGFYEKEFSGSQLTSGVYIYKIQIYPANGGAEGFSETKKMILTK